MDSDMLLATDGRRAPKSEKGSGMQTFLIMLVLIAAIAVIGLQVFIILSVRQTQDLVNTMSNEPGRPVNLAVCKKSLIAYYSSGLYDDDLSKLTAEWWSHFDAKTPSEKDVIISDIDDTVLSNYPEMSNNDFGFIPKLWDDWVYSENASAIPQTRQFLQSLHKKGFKLIYITGRQDFLRNATVGNLNAQGLGFFEQLILRNSSEYKLTAYDYKSARRAQLAAQGWNIVGSIGDQLSDVDGDFAGLRMKVPNYMYFLP